MTWNLTSLLKPLCKAYFRITIILVLLLFSFVRSNLFNFSRFLMDIHFLFKSAEIVLNTNKKVNYCLPVLAVISTLFWKLQLTIQGFHPFKIYENYKLVLKEMAEIYLPVFFNLVSFPMPCQLGKRFPTIGSKWMFSDFPGRQLRRSAAPQIENWHCLACGLMVFILTWFQLEEINVYLGCSGK